MVREMSAEMETVEHQLEDSIASLRDNGIRITPQRQAILKFLIASETHPTADEIYQARAEREEINALSPIVLDISQDWYLHYWWRICDVVHD